jgi:hypothetical protein
MPPPALLRRRRGRHALQDQLDFRPLAGLALETEPAAQVIGDDAVDDMQAEAGAALIAARREERIERLAPDSCRSHRRRKLF